MSLIEILDPAFLKLKLDLIDISISALRDALRGTDNKTLTDVCNTILTRLSETTFTGRWDGGIYGFDGSTPRKILTDSGGRLQINVVSTVNPPNLDVALSTRASETTLSGIKSQTDKLTFDANNRLAIQNPPNLDVALSTRASESTLSSVKTNTDTMVSRLDVALSTRASDSTLSAFSGKFPSAAALGDTMSNPTTTVIGSAVLGFDGTNWRRLRVISQDIAGATQYALTVIPSIGGDISRMPYTIAGINVGTTEGSTSIAAPGAKVLVLRNAGDVDALIGINGSVPATNPLVLRARTIKIIVHKGVTTVSYKTASGSTVIDIEYYN